MRRGEGRGTAPPAVDVKLLLGAVLFGLGWGIGGMCPGPALCSVANPYTVPTLFLAGMFGGFAVAPPLLKLL